MRPLILLTNDDGYDAPGLQALMASLSDLARVRVIAPEKPRSAVSHSITLHKPMRMKEVAEDLFALSGTPVDCVFFGFSSLFGEERPDVVVSGINRGANLGNDVFYSGTVAGAMEGCFMGVPGVAVSQVMSFGEEYAGSAFDQPEDYAVAARLARQVVEEVLTRRPPADLLLNLNVPADYDESKGLRLARMGRRNYSKVVKRREDPRGRPYYWNAGVDMGFAPLDSSDCLYMDQGFATLTPLRADLTWNAFLSDLSSWQCVQG